MLTTLKSLFQRDLEKLKTEINLYTTEAAMWRVIDGTANSGGNLCLHLVGNLNTYIGRDLGGTDYVRDRPLEFSAKDLPKVELLSNIDATILVVCNALDKLDGEDLVKDFPYIVLDSQQSVEYMLLHLLAHLSYHLGQINYHRRIVDSE